MNVSAKTEYACIAVLELAARYGDGKPVRLREIVDANGIPSRFLVQILLQLKNAGFVSSTRGAAGGYQLLVAPENLTLGELMRVFETPATGPANGGSERPIARALRDVWAEIGDAQRRMLESITLAELLERARGEAESMYYI